MKALVGAAPQLFWLGLLVLSQLIVCTIANSVQHNGMLISIVTDPPGPTYPAASWIHVACQPTNYSDSDILMYTWIGTCNETGERIFEIFDPYLDSERRSVLWIPSTPHYCLDYIECHVLNLIKKDEGSASLLIKDIHGVGVAVEDQFLGSIPNNSIIIRGRSPVNILCHSASKTTCSGQWFRPDENIPITASECTPLLYSYVNLSFVAEQGKSGVYTCHIEDKNADPTSVYIGIYNSLQEFQSQAEHLELKLDYNAILDDSGDVSFSCNTKGLLVTSTIWKINNSVIPHKSVEKDDMLIDPYTPSHFSEVTKHGANLSSLSDSSLTCDVYSNWVVADQSTFGQQHVSGEYVIKKVGDIVALECTFPPNNNETEWILPSTLLYGSTIHRQAPNSVLLSFIVMEILHKTTFLCQALNSNGNYAYKHYMLITYVPEDAITMEITEHNYINKSTTTDRDYHNISCCVSIEVEGITSVPTVNWHNSHGEMIPDGGDLHIQQTVSEKLYCTLFLFPSEACGDRLVCRATLLYTADSVPLVKTMTYSITRPTITEEKQKELSSHTLVIIGASVSIALVIILSIITTTLSCTIMSAYKRGRQEAQASDIQISKNADDCKPDIDGI